MKSIKRVLAGVLAMLMAGVLLPTGALPTKAAALTEVRDLGFTLASTSYAKGDKFEKGMAISPAINLKQDLDDVALQVVINITNMDESQPVFKAGDGQIELTSSGGPDHNERYYSPTQMQLTKGRNVVTIPLSSFSTSGGEMDKTNINYFRWYSWTGQAITLEVESVKLLDISNQLRVSSVFGSNMVLQQNKPITITGTAAAGTKVELKMKKGSTVVRSASTTAAAGGTWKVTMDALTGGYDAYTMELYQDGTQVTTLTNILIGEVWLTSGQSNMDFSAKHDPDAYAMLYGENPDPYIRSLEMPKFPVGSTDANYPTDPQSEIAGAYWAKGDDPAAIGGTTAIGYHFAVKLREELDVPVGILNSALGGTNAYSWMSREMIEGNAEMLAFMKKSGKYLTKDNFNKAGSQNFNQMTALYNCKIAPLAELEISGLLWYQGESNVGDELGSYTRFLELLQQDYGKLFGFSGDSMPMIYCHITPELYQTQMYSFDRLGYYAETFNDAWQKHPDTMAQVTTYDQRQDFDYTTFIQEGGIAACHPMYKKDIGTRMAYSALKLAYDVDTEYTAPVLKSFEIVGNKIRVTFDHVGDGLAVKAPSYKEYTAVAADTELRGFTICGADSVFVPAQAKIVGKDTVEIWRDDLETPVAATYAFTQMNQNANLVSTQDGEEMYAAVPFRTAEVDRAQYYRPHDWTYCDIPYIWNFITYDTGERNAMWKVSSGASLAYDPQSKTAGNASLKVSFTGSATIMPTIANASGTPYADTDANYNRYQTVAVDMKNSGSSDLKIDGLRFTKSNGDVYSATLNGTDLLGTTLTAGNWKTLVFNLDRLAKQGDNSQFFERTFLTGVVKIELMVSSADGASAGVVNVDNFVFGMAKADGAGIVDTDVSDVTTPSGDANSTASTVGGTQAGGGISPIVVAVVVVAVVAVLAAGGLIGLAFWQKKKRA